MFHDNCAINFLINIYSDSNQTALQFLSRNVINLENMIIMTGDFNIRDSNWDPLAHHHSIYTDDLMTIADSLGLKLSHPSNPGPTRFANNPYDSNSIIDLVFLPPYNLGFSKHVLHPKMCKPSDHVPLTIEVDIRNTDINIVIRSIKKDSEEELEFLNSITNGVLKLNISNTVTEEKLESSVWKLASIFQNAWTIHSKLK